MMDGQLPQIEFFNSKNNDLFGLYYDGGYIPSGAAGLAINFNMETAGITFSGSSGFVASCLTATTNAGSPYRWVIEPCLSLWPKSACPGGTSECWVVGLGYFDTNGVAHHYSNYYISASTYPTVSGQLLVWYSGSIWIEEVIVTTAGFSSSVDPPVGGTQLYGGSNDWTQVETDHAQAGESFGTAFAWTLTTPQFYVSGNWQRWNVQSGQNFYLYARVNFGPNTPTNKLAILQISNPNGADVYYYGNNPPNNGGQTWSWFIFHCCATLP